MMRKIDTNRTGFTLIELLVVITIIGLLAAILVPSINAAIKSAKRARAMSQIDALDGAIKRFFAEYHKMPVPAGMMGGSDHLFIGTEQAEVILILINRHTDQELNPKQIVFLDLDPASFGVRTVEEMVSLLQSGIPYEDPWADTGGDEGDYGIMMDLNFDDKITGMTFGDIRAKSAVYSGGEDHNMEDPPYKTW